MSPRFWIIIGALLAALGVTAGAVGTHVLKEVLEWPENKLATFETAVRYQMYHALGLVLVGILANLAPSRWLSSAAWLFLAGTLLFSGGIYAWLFTGQTPFVQVVPLGGSAWIVGWLLVAAGAWRCGRST
jgi:uncharacterized membrane protein YgdD (TMEM256/DUF423 family)